MHEGTKTIATIAVELGSSEFAMLRAACASFPHYGPATSGPETSRRSPLFSPSPFLDSPRLAEMLPNPRTQARSVVQSVLPEAC